MIKLSLPYLPISSNDAYMTIKKRGHTLRVLTKEGRKFQKEAKAHLSTTFPMELARLIPNCPYAMYMRLHMPDLENKTWPEVAKNRYKTRDATNRVKLMEDVIAEVSAVDDSNYMMTIPHKVSSDKPWTEIWIWNLDAEGCPFYAAALSL